MEWDLTTFKTIEAVAWTVFLCYVFLFCGHTLVFMGVCALLRKLYMKLKTLKLGLLDTKGKTVVVTGCDQGFGFGCAKRLYEKGFTVFAACLNPDSEGGRALKEVGSERLRVLPLDVTNDDSVSKLLKVVKKECSHSGLWGLVNNAGLIFFGDVELTTMEQYLKVGNVNMYGMVRTCKAFLPLLRQAKGRVVNVTSVKGLLAVPSDASYTLTKYGGEAFSETLRLEMSQFGVHVCIIEPCNFSLNGCLNEAAIKRLKGDLEEQWKEASDDAKQFYGQAHLAQQLEEVKASVKSSSPTIDPVLDAFEDALRNPCPRHRYLVAGGPISNFDFIYVLALIAPYTPQTLFDKIRNYFIPYIVYK